VSPALYLELLQTRRSGWKTIAFAFAGTFLLRLLLPDLGALIALFAVIPQACAAMGIGTFSEELAKGQLRFLFALPVSRRAIWWVKLASGLLGALLVAAAAFAGLWLAQRLRPTEDVVGLAFLLDLLDLAPSRLLPMLAAYTFYGYAAGLFAVLFCRETKHAQLLNIPFAYAPLAFVALVVVPLLGKLPSPAGLAGAFALAAVAMLLGAQRLFVRRNPFDDRVRLWPIGVGATAVAAAVFVASSLVAGTLGHERRAPRPDRVLAFHAAPDGQAVVLIAGNLPGTSGHLLDTDGRVVADLGKDAIAIPGMPIWSPDGRRLLFSRVPTPTLVQAVRGSFTAAPPSAVMFDRLRGTLAEHPFPGGDKDQAPPVHLGWTTSGRPLLLATRYGKGSEPRHELHLLDPATGRFEALPAIAAEGPPKLVDGRLLVYELGGRKPEGEAPELTLFDVASRHQSRLALPAGTTDWAISSDGRRVAVATREVDETSVWLRLSLVEVATGAITPLLGPPDLPRSTLAEAARRDLGWVSVMPLRGTPWVRCDASAEGQPGRSWLLDLAAETVRPIAVDRRVAAGAGEDDGETDSGGLRVPSPDGRRLLAWQLADTEDADRPEDAIQETVVTIEELGAAGVRPVGTLRLAGFNPPAWLGNDRLLYVRPAPGGLGMPQGELWVLDIASGEERRFFNGERAPAAPAR
jgi:hypothetical protein